MRPIVCALIQGIDASSRSPARARLAEANNQLVRDNIQLRADIRNLDAKLQAALRERDEALIRLASNGGTAPPELRAFAVGPLLPST